MSDTTIRRWVDGGRLVRLGYGVFRIGGAPRSFEGDVLAAVLVYPDLTYPSHHTAARLLDLGVWSRDGRIELTRPTGLSADRSTARVHRSTYIPPHHVTHVGAIECLNASRTAFDLARVLGPTRLTRLIDRALLLRLATMGSMYQVLYEMGGRGRPGTCRMRGALEDLGCGHVPAESELEIVGRALLAGLGFEWQVEMADEQGYIRRVDGLHRPASLVLEMDGAQHAREPQRGLDLAHDRRLERLGLRVERCGWGDMTVDGHLTRARLAALIAEQAA